MIYRALAQGPHSLPSNRIVCRSTGRGKEIRNRKGLGERTVLNRRVGGSSPSRPAFQADGGKGADMSYAEEVRKMDKAQELAEAKVRYENSRELRDRAEKIYERDAHAYDLLLVAGSTNDGT